jgi:hypothetical protein
MTNDRTYLRMLSDRELIRAAIDSNDEMAIVLAERLSVVLEAEEEEGEGEKGGIIANRTSHLITS